MVQLPETMDPFEYGFANPEYINGFLSEKELDYYFKKYHHYTSSKRHEKTCEISYYPNPQLYGMNRIWDKKKYNTRKSDINFLEELAQKIEVVFQTRVKFMKITKFINGIFMPTLVQNEKEMVV